MKDTVEFGGWPRPPRWAWAIAGVAAAAALAAVVVARTGPHQSAASRSNSPTAVAAPGRGSGTLAGDKSDWEQLRSLEQLAGRGRYRIVAAAVTAVGPGYQGTVTIDAGSADLVKPQETVLTSAGLVGTVSAVSARTATVLLATDPSAKTGVRISGTRQIGVVSGLGPSQPGLLRLQMFAATAVLRPGEQLVTYASIGDRPYVPGVSVGVITRVQASAGPLTKDAYVRPFANDGTLGVVGVVIAPAAQEPRRFGAANPAGQPHRHRRPSSAAPPPLSTNGNPPTAPARRSLSREAGDAASQ